MGFYRLDVERRYPSHLLYLVSFVFHSTHFIATHFSTSTMATLVSSREISVTASVLITQSQGYHMSFALYQPNFLPPSALVVPQAIYRSASGNGSFNPDSPNAHVFFYDNNVPGISLARAMTGNHRMNGSHEVARLTDSTRVTLRINVSVALSDDSGRGILTTFRSDRASPIGITRSTSSTAPLRRIARERR